MKIHGIAISFFAAALLTPSVWAQTPLRALPADGFKYLPAQEVEGLTDKPGPGVKTAFPVDHENYDVEYAPVSYTHLTLPTNREV